MARTMTSERTTREIIGEVLGSEICLMRGSDLVRAQRAIERRLLNPLGESESRLANRALDAIDGEWERRACEADVLIGIK